jgi:predicted anti-sigma-YlaC factor YlaD
MVSLQNESTGQQQYQNNRYPEMTVGNWVVTLLLLAIPIVNLIMLFIWAFGDKSAKTTFAKAYLIWTVIGLALAAIYIVFVVVLLGATLGEF